MASCSLFVLPRIRQRGNAEHADNCNNTNVLAFARSLIGLFSVDTGTWPRERGFVELAGAKVGMVDTGSFSLSLMILSASFGDGFGRLEMKCVTEDEKKFSTLCKQADVKSGTRDPMYITLENNTHSTQTLNVSSESSLRRSIKSMEVEAEAGECASVLVTEGFNLGFSFGSLLLGMLLALLLVFDLLLIASSFLLSIGWRWRNEFGVMGRCGRGARYCRRTCSSSDCLM